MTGSDSQLLKIDGSSYCSSQRESIKNSQSVASTILCWDLLVACTLDKVDPSLSSALCFASLVIIKRNPM